MAHGTIDLKSEERRRQFTLGALGILLFSTTLPVVNQRALFSPLGDVPILGDLTPIAYAATFGGPPTRFIPSRPAGYGGRPGGDAPPVAFAVRVPPAGSANATPGAPGSPGVSQGPSGPGSSAGQSGSGGGGSSAPGGGGGGGTPGGGAGGGGGGGGASGGSGGGGGGGGAPPPGATGAVPEPSTWLTMILGFAVVGGMLRRARRRATRFASLEPQLRISGG